MGTETFDIGIIGGGINGCGIARDAAGRGLSVVLFEGGDLGEATSSASTKLIHGGLRYLEQYEFRLVREALAEREVLLRLAPHIVRPMRFILPHHSGLRPKWFLRAGLFVYDHLSSHQTLPRSLAVDLSSHPAGIPLKNAFHHAFEYSDCTVDDSRLVILNALDARARGASIRTRTYCLSARCRPGMWELLVEDRRQERSTINVRALVNAAGPWVSSVMSKVDSGTTPLSLRLVKGSHIVVPKLFSHGYAYVFQHKDGRIVFAIPYKDQFTLIGTTDVDYQGDPSLARPSDDEIDYLCSLTNEYFAQPVTRDSVKWGYSGVRPLYDDGSKSAKETTRDYAIDVNASPSGAPVISVLGGKITTFRRLSEEVVDRLSEHLGGRARWTATAPLPGGDIDMSMDNFIGGLEIQYPFVASDILARLAHAYGTRIHDILHNATAWSDLGDDFGSGLTEREVRYLIDNEWAYTADDILWRRTKVGLTFSKPQEAALREWFGRHVSLPS